MNIRKLSVVKTQNNEDILTNEELGTMGAYAVQQKKICEIQLKDDIFNVSLFVNEDVYNTIKDDKEIIVEEKGWWNSLTSKNVVVKRINGDIIKPLKLF